MKLDNFKELLIKKAEDNSNLQLLIKYMREDFLLDHVVESLEKMAASYSKKNPNSAVMHFGTHMDKDTEGDMIHDALSHHASHYKSALDSGNEALADSHMNKIFNIMHMSDKLTRNGLNDHSSGKLKIEAIDPKPWERAGYSNKNPQGKFSTDTKGWGRSGTNYSWLRGAPHESYGKETEVHGHKGAYPLEDIKVNGKYLDISSVEAKGHVDHSFDKHPIMSNYKDSPKDYGTDKHEQYLASHDAYQSSPHMDQYFDKIESLPNAATRGSKKADAVHKPLMSADESLAALDAIKNKVK